MTTDQAEEAAEVAPGAEPSEGVGEATTTADVRRRVLRRVWRPLLAIVAVLLAVLGSLSWWRADHSDSLALARQRDAVLIAATSEIATLNTLDYRSVPSGLAQWAKVTTGTLHDQVTQVSSSERTLLSDQQKISTGKVVDAAVFSLSGDTATVLASVEVSVQDGTSPSTAPTVKRNRFSASMVDVNGVWLVESLEQVAVDIQ